jgi:hypothetical protein
MARRPRRPLGPFVVVHPNGIRPGAEPVTPERVVVRDVGRVEPPPDDQPDPYGGGDWVPPSRRGAR